VDFVKADDMLHPVYHRGEIEMIRKALDRCGRPVVLSLSPGKAPFGMARQLRANADMWRVSADFWDHWEKLARMVELLDACSPFIGAGHWPDADMLPIGHLSLDDRPHGPDRLSRFTWEEHKTLMTLWCIARSPLIMGGDLLSSPEKSLAFTWRCSTSGTASLRSASISSPTCCEAGTEFATCGHGRTASPSKEG
jgi:alpha-galactosidase